MGMRNVVKLTWGILLPRKEYDQVNALVEKEKLYQATPDRDAIEPCGGGERPGKYGVFGAKSLTLAITDSHGDQLETTVNVAFEMSTVPSRNAYAAMTELKRLARAEGIVCHLPQWWLTTEIY